MTRKTVEHIWVNWRLVIIIASAVSSTWWFLGETSQAREMAIQASERRSDARMSRIEKQLDDANSTLTKILLELRRP